MKKLEVGSKNESKPASPCSKTSEYKTACILFSFQIDWRGHQGLPDRTKHEQIVLLFEVGVTSGIFGQLFLWQLGVNFRTALARRTTKGPMGPVPCRRAWALLSSSPILWSKLLNFLLKESNFEKYSKVKHTYGEIKNLGPAGGFVRLLGIDFGAVLARRKMKGPMGPHGLEPST